MISVDGSAYIINIYVAIQATKLADCVGWVSLHIHKVLISDLQFI